MRTKIFSLLLCLAMFSTYATAVTYTADDSTIFPNPERGFTGEVGGETMLSESEYHLLKDKRDSWYFTESGRSSQSLVVLVYYLGNYKSKDIPSKILNGFDDDMQVLRDKGFKCVLRFAYDWKSGNDASLSWVKKHISQLKPHLKDNADVIYALEAGFVGQWGEWYYSSNFGNKTQRMNSDRIAVIDALLDACPTDRFLLVRYPMIKTEYLAAKGYSTSALSSSEAYSTSNPRARIGCHNDAFLNNYGNDGTYASVGHSDDSSVRSYIATETLYVPNGGETNVDDDDLAKQVYKNAESEMATYHWSFCGDGYARQVTDRWKSSGIFNTLERKMGYCFQLKSGSYSSSAVQGGTMSVNISLKNVGYAPLYNKRYAYIVLKNSSKKYSIRLATDPRKWKPGETVTINETISLPSDIATGTYQIYLNLPDRYESLASKPAFSVRFANKNVWESSTGMNNLNASITISKNNGGNNGGGGNTGSTVSIPNTLTKSNVASVSSDMTYYNSNFFDFGPTDAHNLDRWAEWSVKISSSGEYTVSTTGYYPNGHQWQLELVGGNTTYTMPSSHKTGEVTEEGTSTWYLPSGTYKIRVKNIKDWGQPKLKSIKLAKAGSSAIVLPATLNKSNESAHSSDMTYYNSSLYDFGPTDAANLDRWVEWEIKVANSGNYNVATTGYYPNGHQWQLELVGASNTYAMPKSYASGTQTEAGSSTWYLSSGTYTLRIKNILQWSQAKLQNITITSAANYKPQAINEVEVQQLDMNAPMYDILGRQVGASYKGIVIQNGQKYLLK
ncbi:MAG: DUF4832 domain-containing protein [Paludibacteraceae bacterium]|nr:DUF4832 domain-containing protein [Paludibacteraceae bacterium]